MTKPSTHHYVYKSAKDGKFVSEKYAETHPATTFKEKVNNPKK